MSKRTVFTTVTPLPTGITRETVMETLRSHTEMIDLNPLVEERHPIKPPQNATAEEYHCLWYSLTDRVQYLPGGLMSGKVSYTCCFHDLEYGLQTHCYAPMGLNIRGKWTLGGSLPGEPVAPVEMGAGVPLDGLWLREDVDMKCNIMMTSFVKKTIKKSHSALVERLVVKAQMLDRSIRNSRLNEETLSMPELTISRPSSSQTPSSRAPTAYSPTSDYDNDSAYAEPEVDSPQYTTYAMQNTQGSQTPKTYPSTTLQNPQSQISQVPPALRAGPPQNQTKPQCNENSTYSKYDPSAYPRALNVRRESAPSWNDSVHGSEIPTGRMSYQSPAGNVRNEGNRARVASWQNAAGSNMWNTYRPLNAGTQKVPAHYRSASSQLEHRTSPPVHERRDDSGKQNTGNRVVSQLPAYHAELEG
ncbi:249e0210-0b9c-4d0c-b807-66f63c6696c6 [Sclerotinia trifoliorum]|uniref:249e0210-0b9c-4d0c-b807-66f63c6696c6 n=1 Tax=Sclerotinia trifoliorum TaxID=28548 RepID=A0A8H2W5U6_9HELO|nr:249e0210-0b9c-4d0c-b807-66f63c6696c6 [Sclerotinia trifoliorum]